MTNALERETGNSSSRGTTTCHTSPVLLENVSYPEQVEYWLQGWQMSVLHDDGLEQAMPKILDGLRAAGVGAGSAGDRQAPRPAQPPGNLDALWKLARLTDQMWPVVAERSPARSTLRDLGAPQDELQRSFALGERVRIALESDREAYLLLLDMGTSGKVYCLCPSAFSPEQRIDKGVNYLPQEVSPYRRSRLPARPGASTCSPSFRARPWVQNGGRRPTHDPGTAVE